MKFISSIGVDAGVHNDRTGLVLNIGITGHRNIAPMDHQKLKEQCKKIFARILKIVEEAHSGSTGFYSQDRPQIRVITSLAEGFDRIAAHAALDMGFEIQCPLPRGKADYMKDFETQESKDEFLELADKAAAVFELDVHGKDDRRAYLDSGVVMLDHSDLVVACWDGRQSAGPGGTGDIVGLAGEQGIPVIVIKKDDISQIGYMFSDRNNIMWEQALESYLKELLVPEPEEDGEEPFSRTFFGERADRKNRAFLYRGLEKIFSPREKEVKKGPRQDEDYKPDPFFRPFFEKADALAEYYADYYRSAGVLRNIIPLFASVAMAFGFYWKWGENPDIINVLGFISQAVLIYLLVYILGSRNEKKKWHQKSMDYRILAELLRQAEFLLPMGITLKGVKAQAYELNSRASWVNWYFRSIIRKIGLCSCKIDNAAMEFYAGRFKEKLLLGQKNFYRKSAERKKAVAARLQKCGVIFFNMGIAVTVLRVIVHFLYQIDRGFPVWYMGIKISTFFNMLCLLLPAAGTAVFAVAAQAGFDRLGKRYEMMEKQIGAMIDDIDQASRQSYRKLAGIMQSASGLLIEEVSDWRLFFKGKGISKR